MNKALLTFMAVAEQRSFTRAAGLLHMTQPAVSQYIQTLERSLGAKLLDRTNKYVQLNKAGEIVYHHAKEIVGLYTRMTNLLDDLQHTAGGPLVIGASYTFGEYILPRLLTRLLADYPDIEPSLQIANTKDIIALTAKRQLDVGIVEGERKGKEAGNIRWMTFAEDDMVLVAAPDHPVLQNKQPEPVKFGAYPWIVREEGSGTREMQQKAFGTLGIQPDRLIVMGSTQAVKEAVEAGLGLSLLSRHALRKELAAGSLASVPCAGFPLKRRFSLILPDSAFQTKAVERFVALVRESADEWMSA